MYFLKMIHSYSVLSFNFLAVFYKMEDLIPRESKTSAFLKVNNPTRFLFYYVD